MVVVGGGEHIYIHIYRVFLEIGAKISFVKNRSRQRKIGAASVIFEITIYKSTLKLAPFEMNIYKSYLGIARIQNYGKL